MLTSRSSMSIAISASELEGRSANMLVRTPLRLRRVRVRVRIRVRVRVGVRVRVRVRVGVRILGSGLGHRVGYLRRRPATKHACMLRSTGAAGEGRLPISVGSRRSSCA